MKIHQYIKEKKRLRRTVIILFWLCIWQLVTVWTDNKILLVGPWQVFLGLIRNIVRPDFCKIVIYSLCRIGIGFFLALFCGFALGALSYRYELLEEFLAPIITTLKSIPVASFVILLLIWFGSALLSFFISFLIVFPNIYINTKTGFKSVDRQLLEMADVFHIRGWGRFFYLYRPAFMPYLTSALKVSLGMSWKSGVAAEVIGMPGYSLGERLYVSKIYLDTAGLFAWTFLIILFSFLFEKAVLYLVEKFGAWNPLKNYDRTLSCSGKEQNRLQVGNESAADARKEESVNGGKSLCIRNLDKAFGELQVLKDFSLTMEEGRHYCLMAPSGSGKTTLLHLISHLQQPDAGTIEGVPEHIGMVFQEDRLCEDYDTITNVMLTITNVSWRSRKRIAEEASRIRKEALRILPESCLDQPVRELSGGMRRRLAILRAMLSEAELFIMDEPFTGLDEDNRHRMANYILEKLHGRTLLVSTHREEDVKLLEAVRVKL